MTRKNALIIDGNALIYRNYFASLSNNTKNSTALITIYMIKKILKLKKYDYALIALDAGKSTWRTTKFHSYKSNRPPMPKELYEQFKLLKEICETSNIKSISVNNFEADDIIASFNKICSNNNINVDIYSTDQDLLQLISNNTSVHLLQQGLTKINTYNYFNFTEKYHGLLPKQIITLKSLAGDPSDNYKGITGIGKKGAITLIQKYNSIENIYNNINDLTPKQKKSLQEEKELLYLFQEIATLTQDVQIPQDIENYNIESINYLKLNEFINTLK